MDIQLGRSKVVRRAYGIDEIALVPGGRTVDPEVTNTSWSLGAIEREIPIIASAMDGVVDVGMAVRLSQLGALGVLNLEGIQTRYEDPTEALDRITSVGKDEFVPLMQELYSKPVQESLIRKRIEAIKSQGGIAAVSGTPVAALRFGKAIAEAGADLFFVQATVVSTNHIGPEGQDTLDLEALCRDMGVPVVIGNCVTYDVALQLMRAGAAGVMVAPISGLNTEKKLYEYFVQVFDALGPDIPVCYQDYPQSTGVHISVECFNRLVKNFPQLVMLKHEDCPGLGKLTQVRDTSKSKNLRRISILTGNGGLYLPQELARGADGAMTGFAFPEMLVEVVSLHAEGKTDQAEEIFDTYLPLVRYEQQPGFGLAIRKEILRQRGAISCAITRSPGPSLSQSDYKELSNLIVRLERKLNEMDC